MEDWGAEFDRRLMAKNANSACHGSRFQACSLQAAGNYSRRVRRTTLRSSTFKKQLFAQVADPAGLPPSRNASCGYRAQNVRMTQTRIKGQTTNAILDHSLSSHGYGPSQDLGTNST